MKPLNAGKRATAARGNAFAFYKVVVMHALYAVWRYYYKPRVLVGVVFIALVEVKGAIGAELNLQVKQAAVVIALYHKIGHIAQGATKLLVVVAQAFAKAGVQALQPVVKYVVVAVYKQVLYQVFGHAAF